MLDEPVLSCFRLPFNAFRNKNVLDNLYYNFIQRLVIGDQSRLEKGIPSSASLQLGIR